jgi:hypothetical protein
MLKKQSETRNVKESNFLDNHFSEKPSETMVFFIFTKKSRTMKYLTPCFFLLLFLSACSRNCDVSTAQGAADCTCKLMKAFDDAKGDPDKTKEVAARFDQFQKDFEKNISEGLYTEEEVNELIDKNELCK